MAILLLILGGAIGAEPQQCLLSSLPANVELPRDLARVLERIYQRSPAFRAQCERIADASHLRVTVRVNTAIPSRCRAFTIMTRRGDRIMADVHLPLTNGLVELVAHEFEHVIEQIEGLDLKRLARIKGSGVHELEGRVFETDRAQRAGRAVLAEMERRGLANNVGD
jgi:hypothetical protein